MLNLYLLLAIAVIALAVKLPPYMSRIGMPNADKITFAIFAFSLLILAWFGVRIFGMFI
jgi:hypothetical protein